MANENQPTGLSTEPVTATPKKRTGKKKAISKAVTIGKSLSKKFKSGDPVLIHIKQHHGMHAVVVDPLGNDQYLIRGVEAAIEGQLFHFSGDQLVPATDEHLAIENNHERLDWDYKD